MSLDLILNGQTRTFDQLQPEASIADLVGALGLKSDRIAIEQNGEIVSRARWAGVRLMPGDKLEMVHFVGGGNGSTLLNSICMRDRCSEHPEAVREVDGGVRVEEERVPR